MTYYGFQTNRSILLIKISSPLVGVSTHTYIHVDHVAGQVVGLRLENEKRGPPRGPRAPALCVCSDEGCDLGPPMLLSIDC